MMLDEKYVTDAVQDPHEPVWESDAVIADMQEVDDPNDTYPGDGKVPTVRTNTGILDFMNNLAEETDNFLSRQDPPTPKKAKLDTIRTRELGTDKWRAGRREVTANMPYPIVTCSSKRRKLTLINYGPDVVYISSVGGTVAGASNTARIQVSSATFWAPVEISTCDDVWAVCAVTETATVDIIEEFDMES